MQCPKCGWNNPDNAAKCNNCFTDLAPAAPQPPQEPQPPQQVPQQPYSQPPQQPYGQQPYGQQPYAQGGFSNIPDYMAWSIVVTVISACCCLISLVFGIIAIVKSSSANSKKAVGDYLGAQSDANAAKTWLYWAAGLDIVGLIASIIIFMIHAASQMSHYSP